MITVEDLLMAYASAYDAWLDPETERKNPTPEYAELIRQAVSFENAKLRELLAKVGRLLPLADWTNVRYDEMASEVMYGIDELGVEVDE